MSESKPIDFTQEFTQSEKEIIIKWYESTIKKKNCIACGANSGFAPLGSPTTKVIFDRKNDRHRNDKVIMFITFICKNCGHSRDFFADTVGFGTKHGPEKHDLARQQKAKK